jgi:PAS domain S-box-containing protein
VEAGAQQMFGYSTAEALGRPIQILVPQKLQPAYQNRLEQYLAVPNRELAPGSAELVGRRNDGAEFPIDVSYGTWMADGEIFFTALIRDLTERKHAEQALRELSGRVLRLQDEERSRLARELHDGTSQTLAALHLHVATLDRVIPAESLARLHRS